MTVKALLHHNSLNTPTPFRKSNKLKSSYVALIFNVIFRASVASVVIVLLHISAIARLFLVVEDPIAQFEAFWPNRHIGEDGLRASVARNNERRRFELCTLFCFEF